MSRPAGSAASPVRLSLLTALLLISASLSLLLGSTELSPGDVLRAWISGDFSSTAWRIFCYSRLPRTLGAILCGSALAVSGSVLQVVLNNSLAGPNLIGVNAGAGFAVLLVMALFPAQAALLPAAAFAGAMLCAVLIYSVARATGASRMTLILAGVAVTSVINAASSCIKTFFPDILASYTRFSIGSLNGVRMDHLRAAAPYLLPGLLAALLLSRDMDVLALGEEVAQSLGLQVERCRLLLLLCAAVLAGSAVSVCGLLGFVGLLVPHAARLLVGGSNLLRLTASILLGASSVLLCDLLGRVLFAPYELPVGVVLSLVGGGCFLVLLLRRKGGRLRD